jgi:hypothetical protein
MAKRWRLPDSSVTASIVGRCMTSMAAVTFFSLRVVAVNYLE